MFTIEEDLKKTRYQNLCEKGVLVVKCTLLISVGLVSAWVTFPFVHYYNKFLSPTSILECNSHKIKIHVSEHFEFRHFRSHYLDVDTIFGDLRRKCLHQRIVRNTKTKIEGFNNVNIIKKLPLKSAWITMARWPSSF
jgi:hypothetical protein